MKAISPKSRLAGEEVEADINKHTPLCKSLAA